MKCHIFGCFRFISTIIQLFSLLILCHDFSSISIYLTLALFQKEGGDFQPITELSSVRWRFSANHRALVIKVAIFNQSQRSARCLIFVTNTPSSDRSAKPFFEKENVNSAQIYRHLDCFICWNILIHLLETFQNVSCFTSK